MKKFYLLTKTLLVATMLLAGASNAWADAEIPVYNSTTGFYELNEVSYVKKTYSFGDYTYANNSSDTSFPAGFTGSNVTRYKNSISQDGTKAIAGSPIEITFRNMEPKDTKKSAFYYFYAGIGMQVNNQVTIYLAGSNASTIAVLNYKVGAASDKPTVADATLQTEVKTGLIPGFDLKDKDTYYYLYESVDVYNPVSTETIDGIAPAADGYYYKDGARYTRTTYDFRHYTRYGSYSEGSPAGFSVATSTNRYQVSYNTDKTDIPTGLTYGRTDKNTAYVVFCDTYGMQANGNSTLSVTTKDCNTVAYLFHKVGNKSAVVTEATALEVFESESGESLSFTLNNKNGDEPWLYTRMEVFQKVSESVTVTSAGYATYVSTNNLDFTSTSIKAYTATVNTSTGVVTLTPINKVPAGTPVVLYKDGGATENIPVAASTDEVGDNDLVAGTGGAVATGTGPYNYILNNVSGIGFYRAAGQTVAANRAYLQTTYVSSGARGMTLEFADDILTGINEAEAATEAVAKEGKFFENGKLIIFKKGMKFYANGQVIK